MKNNSNSFTDPLIRHNSSLQKYYFKKAFYKSKIFQKSDSVANFLSLNDQQNNIHFLSRKRKLIKLMLAILAWILMILLMCENELYYSLGDSNWSSVAILNMISLLTFCFAISKVLSIYLYREVLVAQGLRSPREPQIDFALIRTFVFYLIHPMYIFHTIKFDSDASFPPIQFQRPLNDYLMIFQTFLLAFEILTYVLFDQNKKEEALRIKIRKDHLIDPAVFFLKYYLSKRPLKLIMIMITFGVFYLSFLLKISESPEQVRAEGHLYLWANCVWLAFVTMLTIGYGDLHPITYQGRLVAITMGMFGYVFFSLVLTSIGKISQFTNAEAEIVNNLKWSDLTQRNEKNAASVIVNFCRLWLNVSKGIQQNYVSDKTKLEISVIKLNRSRMELKKARLTGEAV